MKNIVEYICEASTSDFKKDLEEWAWGIIDEFNQEGVVGFDERDWEDYIDGTKEPDYKQIVDEILYQYQDDNTPSGKKAIAFIKDYDKNKDEVDAIILKAANSYLNNY